MQNEYWNGSRSQGLEGIQLINSCGYPALSLEELLETQLYQGEGMLSLLERNEKCLDVELCQRRSDNMS